MTHNKLPQHLRTMINMDFKQLDIIREIRIPRFIVIVLKIRRFAKQIHAVQLVREFGLQEEAAAVFGRVARGGLDAGADGEEFGVCERDVERPQHADPVPG